MRHRHGYKKLGRDSIHRRALLKNLAIALVKHERIVTTLAKAKELRRTGDKMIGLAKKDTEASRKTAWWWMRHPDLMVKLFGPLKERYVTRPGGYTRVLRMPNRKGDNAPMAVVEYVDNRFPPLRSCRDSMKACSKLLSQQSSITTPQSFMPEQALFSGQEGALTDMLSKLDLNDGNPAEQVRPGAPFSPSPGLSSLQKSVVGAKASDMGTPV